MNRIVSVSILGILLLMSCGRQTSELLVYSGEAQGTTFSIKYFDSLKQVQTESFDSIFRVADACASLWDTTSLLCRINRNEDVAPNDHLLELFTISKKISEETEGFFDITVGRLVSAWGFGRKQGRMPDSSRVKDLLRCVGAQYYDIENGEIKKWCPEIMFDLNAIAQGYTVDLIAEYLTKSGIRNFMVEVGGEVYAHGRKADGTPWKIGIEKPCDDKTDEQVVQNIVEISGKALATSGSYRKYFEKDGRRYSHAIDPHTGFPVTHSVLSVSVIADNCAFADAYATAFFVAGENKSKEFLDKHPELSAYFIAQDSSGTLKELFFNSFEKYLSR